MEQDCELSSQSGGKQRLQGSVFRVQPDLNHWRVIPLAVYGSAVKGFIGKYELIISIPLTGANSCFVLGRVRH